MASTKIAYGSSTAITITLNSLATSATVGRESTAVVNTSNLYLDALVTVILKIPAGTPANDFGASIYAYASEDGTNYSTNATGSDAAITIPSYNSLMYLGFISLDTQSITNKGVFSIAQAFGGILPPKWGIVVLNYCGINLDSSGNSASYSGVYATVA